MSQHSRFRCPYKGHEIKACILTITAKMLTKKQSLKSGYLCRQLFLFTKKSGKEVEQHVFICVCIPSVGANYKNCSFYFARGVSLLHYKLGHTCLILSVFMALLVLLPTFTCQLPTISLLGSWFHC